MRLRCLIACFVASPAFAGFKEDPVQVGSPAPLFRLPQIDDPKGSLNLRELVGIEAKKPQKVILSFGSASCGPCRQELKEFKDLAADFTARNIVFAVVVIDSEPQDIEVMRKLTKDELKLPYSVILDRYKVVAKRYQAEKLPLTVVIKPDGNVEWLGVGFDEAKFNRFKKEVLGMESVVAPPTPPILEQTAPKKPAPTKPAKKAGPNKVKTGA